MRIVFDASTIEQASGSITGVVHFEFGEVCFPAQRWNDFAVVISSWWLEAVQKLDVGLEREVLFRFMDGPYQLAATRMGDEVRLRCIHRRVSSEDVQHEETVKLADLRTEVLRLVRAVATACFRAGMQSPDLDKLKSQLPN